MSRPTDDRSLGELLGDLSREVTTLVRQEMALAKAEVGQKASKIGKDVGFIAAGGLVAYAGVLALVAFLILALDHVMPLWAAALVVGLVVAGAGAALVMQGLNHLRKADLAPRETIETLKEDARWMKERAR